MAARSMNMRVILAVEAIGSSDCGGKFESCGELIAMDDDELQEHCILYTVILGESVHGTFISLNKLIKSCHHACISTFGVVHLYDHGGWRQALIERCAAMLLFLITSQHSSSFFMGIFSSAMQFSMFS
jgi:hypothetical protein